MTVRELRIQGFDRKMNVRGDLVRYTDRQNKDHHQPLDTVIHYCEEGMFGLTPQDAETFRAAYDKHLVELEIGRKIPGKLHFVGERVCEHR